MTSPEDKSPLEAFLERYWADREAGTVRDLPEYLTMFPGDPDGVAREYLRCKEGGDSTVPNLPGDGPNADMLGPYRLDEELGRGGQGIVHKATDTRIGRTVALKVLRGLGPGADEVLLRFKREAQAASKSDHPGVCPVYDARVDGGVPYIAMRYIEGETLAERIASTRNEVAGEAESTVVDLNEIVDFEDPETQADEGVAGSTPQQTQADIMRAVRLIEQIARALHAVHEAGVVHRDMKPGNVMITPKGEAIVMDFGLAKDQESDLESLTEAGDFFGTPAYMSPEQLTRKTLRVDRRTDVWALGVMLYECVTLSRPFQEATNQALFQAILMKDPKTPRRINPQIPPDLALVIQTALSKDRDQRYQSAEALAEDLRRVRALEPILATAPSLWSRASKWWKRNPASVRAIAVLVPILVLVTWERAIDFAVRSAKSPTGSGFILSYCIALSAWTMWTRRKGFRQRLAENRLGTILTVCVGLILSMAIALVLRREADSAPQPTRAELAKRYATGGQLQLTVHPLDLMATELLVRDALREATDVEDVPQEQRQSLQIAWTKKYQGLEQRERFLRKVTQAASKKQSPNLKPVTETIERILVLCDQIADAVPYYGLLFPRQDK